MRGTASVDFLTINTARVKERVIEIWKMVGRDRKKKKPKRFMKTIFF